MLDHLPLSSTCGSASTAAYHPLHSIHSNDSKRRQTYSKAAPICAIFCAVILLVVTRTSFAYMNSQSSSSSMGNNKHIHHHIHPPLDYEHKNGESKEVAAALPVIPTVENVNLSENEPTYNIHKPLVISGPSGVGETMQSSHFTTNYISLKVVFTHKIYKRPPVHQQ